MLIAIAFLCAVSAPDAATCEREAIARAIVGQGVTPIGCLADGQAGAAANEALALDGEHRIVIACRRKG